MLFCYDSLANWYTLPHREKKKKLVASLIVQKTINLEPQIIFSPVGLIYSTEKVSRLGVTNKSTMGLGR